MKWLTRLLWLAAWSAWALLGLGLHRELPRKIVSARELPLGTGDKCLGFIGRTNRVVVLTWQGTPSPTIKVYDAETGELVREDDSPTQLDSDNDENAVRHGVLFANRRPTLKVASSFYLFDVDKGEWRQLVKYEGRDISVHPRRPWVVFTENGRRVVAMDFKTGREVFARDLPNDSPRPSFRHPYFLSDDRILVQLAEGTHLSPPPLPLQRNLRLRVQELDDFALPERKGRLEVWRIGDPPDLERTIDGELLEQIVPAADGGRVTYWWSHFRGPVFLGVFDFTAGRTIFAPLNLDKPFSTSPLRLSPSGRAVLGGRPVTLREVDTGRVRWTPPAQEFFATTATPDAFQVIESWHSFWKGWFPNRPFTTRAVRSMETGTLLHRSTWEDTWIPPHLFNADRTLAIANGGRVYSLPPSVNWPLLAVFQTILALPLILLWSLLRCRHRRAARRKPAEVSR